MARVRPLAEFIQDCIGPACAAQGFASTDVVEAWSEIVGERLARYCQPVRLEWPRRRRDAEGRGEPGTLVVRVESAFALELQHLAPVVTERINAHYGWACIGRIVLRQDRLRRPGRPLPPRPLDPARAGEVAAAVLPIAEDGLREALGRLGLAIAAAQPGRR